MRERSGCGDRRSEVSKFKDETISELRTDGMKRQDVQNAAWKAILDKYPLLNPWGEEEPQVASDEPWGDMPEPSFLRASDARSGGGMGKAVRPLRAWGRADRDADVKTMLADAQLGWAQARAYCIRRPVLTTSTDPPPPGATAIDAGVSITRTFRSTVADRSGVIVLHVADSSIS